MTRRWAALHAVLFLAASLPCQATLCAAAEASGTPAVSAPQSPPMFSHTPHMETEETHRNAQRALWCSDQLRKLYGFTTGPILGDGDAWYQMVPEGMGLPPESRILLVRGSGTPAPGPEDEAAFWDTLSMGYPQGEQGRYPQPGFDPGRLRSQALMQALYGADETAVRTHLKEFDLLGQRFLFAKRHGAYHALQRALTDIEAHLASHPQDREWVSPSPGTFAWRRIAGSGRISAHSFGIAIDLNADKGLYWQWKPGAALLEKTRQSFPQAIVDAFERQGFIWGGKWAAYDFMHFEYRPELFLGIPPHLLN